MKRFGIGLCLFLLASCQGSSNDSKRKRSDEGIAYDLSDFEGKHRWIQKLGLVLGSGKSHSETQINVLKEKPPQEIVQYFLDKPDFLFTLVKFNVFFLGFENSWLTMPKAQISDQLNFSTAFIGRSVTNFPSAVHSALEYQKDGDIFSLFDFARTGYLSPIPNIDDDAAAAFALDFGSMEKRIPEYERAFQTIDKIVHYLSNLQEIERQEISDKIKNFRDEYNVGDFLFGIQGAVGFGNLSFFLVGQVSNLWSMFDRFVDPDRLEFKHSHVREMIQEIKLVKSYLEIFRSLELDRYEPKTLADLKPVRINDLYGSLPMILEELLTTLPSSINGFFKGRVILLPI